MPIYGLMYSGGVDSVLCLQILVDECIIPILFHVQTKELTPNLERRIKRNAKRLSPKSPYYAFKAYTNTYRAIISRSKSIFGLPFLYYARLVGRKVFTPHKYCDVLVLGYSKEDGITYSGNPIQEFMELVDIHARHKFLFPLRHISWVKIEKLFNSLPPQIIKDTVSSTRNYEFGGVCELGLSK